MQRSPIRSIRINNSKEFETDITEENYAELAKGMSLFETVTFCDHSGSTHQLRLKRSSILLLLGAFHTHPELIEKLDLYEKETQNILFISNNKTTSTLLDFILTQEHANLIVQQLSAISWCPLSRNTGSANDKNNYLNSTAMRKFSMPKLQSFGTVIIPGAINPANYRTTYKNYMSESKNYSFENIQFF